MTKRLEQSNDLLSFRDLPINRAPRANQITDIGGRICFVTLANVVNVSLGGVGIETQDTLQLDHTYKIHMEETSLTLDGRAVWHEHTETREDEAGELVTMYRSGLEFDRSAIWSRREQLQHFLEHNTEKPVGDRGAVPRYRLTNDTPRVLQANFPFCVRNLSAAGMIAECYRLPSPNTLLNLVIDLPNGAIRVKAFMVDVFEDLDLGQRTRKVAFDFQSSSEFAQQAINEFVRAS